MTALIPIDKYLCVTNLAEANACNNVTQHFHHFNKDNCISYLGFYFCLMSFDCFHLSVIMFLFSYLYLLPLS